MNSTTQFLINAVIVLLLIALGMLAISSALKSIDRITARDCVRGIKSACVECQKHCNDEVYDNMIISLTSN